MVAGRFNARNGRRKVSRVANATHKFACVPNPGVETPGYHQATATRCKCKFASGQGDVNTGMLEEDARSVAVGLLSP